MLKEKVARAIKQLKKGKEKGFITVEAVEGGYKLTYDNGYSEVI